MQIDQSIAKRFKQSIKKGHKQVGSALVIMNIIYSNRLKKISSYRNVLYFLFIIHFLIYASFAQSYLPLKRFDLSLSTVHLV